MRRQIIEEIKNEIRFELTSGIDREQMTDNIIDNLVSQNQGFEFSRDDITRKIDDLIERLVKCLN